MPNQTTVITTEAETPAAAAAADAGAEAGANSHCAADSASLAAFVSSSLAFFLSFPEIDRKPGDRVGVAEAPSLFLSPTGSLFFMAYTGCELGKG